jgi:hypothetical protein
MQYEIKTREKSKELLYGAMIAAVETKSYFDVLKITKHPQLSFNYILIIM